MRLAPGGGGSWLSLVVLMAAGQAGGGAPVLREAELEALIPAAEAWVVALRDRHHPHARPLTAGERRALGPFFPAAVIDEARVRRVPAIPNPEFYELFRRRGEPVPIDFSRMTALAVVDTVLVVESALAPGARGWLGLLFHELVHNTQRRVLGARDTELYVRGWAATGSYHAIPHEAQAYELAARYRAAPERVFSVEAEVRRMAWELLSPAPGMD